METFLESSYAGERYDGDSEERGGVRDTEGLAWSGLIEGAGWRDGFARQWREAKGDRHCSDE